MLQARQKTPCKAHVPNLKKFKVYAQRDLLRANNVTCLLVLLNLLLLLAKPPGKQLQEIEVLFRCCHRAWCPTQVQATLESDTMVVTQADTITVLSESVFTAVRVHVTQAFTEWSRSACYHGHLSWLWYFLILFQCNSNFNCNPDPNYPNASTTLQPLP